MKRKTKPERSYGSQRRGRCCFSVALNSAFNSNDDLGGFDENLPSNFNDVDFCLRLREQGCQIVWTPYADLIHNDSASRGRDSGPAWRAQLLREAAYMLAKWGEQLRQDPFYSPNLSYSLGFTLAWPPRLPPLRDSLKSAAEEIFTESF
jgi:GT2 family glycosyltransferase